MTAPGFKGIVLTQPIYQYLLGQAAPPVPAQRWLIEQTTMLGGPAEMQIPHEQGIFLTLLTQVAAARRVVDVGTFTGYSALAFALGMPAHGQVITCDVSEQWTEIAREGWRQAGVADRIDLRIAPAIETLRALPPAADLDLAFLDADKVSYRDYWDELVPRMRPGGLLLADNVLYAGEAADPGATGNAHAIREFNDRVRADQRVCSVMLPIADGLTIARKLP
jgi:caffeoyl-CoA O-methyltransferase